MIHLPHDFTLREYQIEPWNATMRPEFKRGLMVVPRRNGKDILGWNILIAKAMQRVGLYYYIAPFYNQIRQIIWEGFDFQGRRFLDYIPEELITNKTKLDMRIDLVNGSQIKLQGSDEVDRIVGTNPFGIVMTEFSLHKPAAWNYLRPVLAENGGWALFNGTPRGQNHMFELYQLALAHPHLWYTQFLTRDDTGIPTLDAIEADRESGMPEELIMQEYYCSFTSGVVGAYYAEKITELRREGKITEIPYDPRFPVHTCWDLGVQKSGNAIWFFQIIGGTPRFIDYYENPHPKTGLPTYAKEVRNKPYVYGTHIAPHDIEVTEWGSETTRKGMAGDLGIDFITVPRGNREDGIEMVRTLLNIAMFDAVKCHMGLKRLSDYTQKRDEKNKVYTAPLANEAAHGADSFRMGAVAILGDMVDNYFAQDRPETRVITSKNSEVFDAFRGRVLRTEGVQRYTPSNRAYARVHGLH